MIFAALLRLSGLSPEEASVFFGVRRRVILGWMRPEGAPPRDALEKLFALIDRQEAEAERIIVAWEEAGRPARFEGDLAATDEEAQSHGWPTVSAQAVPAAIAQATLTHVEMRLNVNAVEPADATAKGDEAQA